MRRAMNQLLPATFDGFSFLGLLTFGQQARLKPAANSEKRPQALSLKPLDPKGTPASRC